MHNQLLSLNKTVQHILKQYLQPDTKLLVGVSGGPDSMYLLSQLKRFWKEDKRPNDTLHIISCHHHTRPNIETEMQLVHDYSSPHPRVQYDYTGDDKSEETLRNRRHTSYIEYSSKNNISHIALGHHLDDRIESTFLNMLRGCGIEGIRTMPGYQEHFMNSTYFIIRPLIHLRKSYIVAQCEAEQIPYIVDPSNTDPTTSKRNTLRTSIQQHDEYDKFSESFDHLYHYLDQHTTTPQSTIISKELEVSDIGAGQRSSDSLYQLYQSYHITINPRSTTLEQLAQQLSKSGNTIEYQGLRIKS